MYAFGLSMLQKQFPPDTEIDRHNIHDFRNALETTGHAPATIGTYLSAVNSYCDFIGARELIVPLPQRKDEKPKDPLTRPEYIRLLQTARRQNRPRTYMLIKLFASTGIGMPMLPRVTASAVKKGEIVAQTKEKKTTYHIPKHLQAELLTYAREIGVYRGPIFLNKEGTRPINRIVVINQIQLLCRDARVAPEKVSPGKLQELYLNTQATIEASLHLRAQKEHDELLENEQAEVAWDSGGYV